MTAISKKPNRKGLFKDSYTIDYALRITECHTLTHQVLSVRCLFCIYLGREDNPGETRLRQQTANAKDWNGRFRTEKFKNHHEGQHPNAWRRYQVASKTEKSTFFDAYIAYENTLFAKFEPAQTPFAFYIDAPIVDIIIGNMFFHPDDHDSTTHINALKLFKRNNDTDRYEVTWANSLQFGLIIDLIAAGLSFRQVESALNAIKARTGLGKLGCINDTGIANNVHALCGINLQMISEIFNSPSIWAFSLANDSSTHYGHSYFDNRIRIHYNGVIFNIHILAIPMFE